MVEFAEQRIGWLSEILDLPNGTPSHDTFNRVLQLIDPEQFALCLAEDAVGLTEGVTAFRIGSPAEIPNSFSDMRNGIIAQHSLLFTQNNDFSNLYRANSGVQEITPAIVGGLTGIGIYLFNATGLIENGNSFTNLDRGVHAQSSNLSVRDNTFSTNDGIIINGGDFRWLDVFNNFNVTFANRGVEVSATENPAWLRVVNNIFFNSGGFYSGVPGPPVTVTTTQAAVVVYGGMAGGGGEREILDNHINLTPDLPGLSSTDVRGIWLQDGNEYEIHRNTIDYSNFGTDFNPGPTALTLLNSNSCYLYGNTVNGQDLAANGIINSASAQNTYCCNTVNSTQFSGLQFGGMSDGTVLRHTDLGGSHGHGLLTTGIMGQQGNDPNIMDTHGNLWNGSFVASGATHTGTIDEIQSSLFFVEDSDPTTPAFDMDTPLWPPTFFPVNDWFLPSTFSSSNCADDEGQCPVQPNIKEENPEEKATDNDIRYAQGTYDATGSVPVINWEGKRYLYKRLKASPAMLNDTTVIDSFYNVMENSNFRLFYETDEAVENFYYLDSMERAELASDQATLGFLNQSINEVDSLLQYAASEQDSAALFSQRQSLLSQMVAPYNNIEHIHDSLRLQRNSATAAAIVLNAGITTSGVLEANLQTVNDVFLQTVAQGIHYLDNNQFSAISAIAFQCPDQGGNAVYTARKLYHLNAFYNFDDAVICSGGKSNNNPMHLKKPKTGFRIYPNPASSILMVQLDASLKGTEHVDIVIYSMAGTLLKQVNELGEKSLIEVAIDDLSNGIYWCQIAVDGKVADNQKIVVLR